MICKSNFLSCSLIENEVKKVSDFKKAEHLKRFFKTSKGSYGEHDKFLGVTVPNVRLFAKKYIDTELETISSLISSEFNEIRLLALLILRLKYEKEDFDSKSNIINFYIDKMDHINNWNLVDLSAPYIIGDFAQKTKSDILLKLMKSENIWKKRISIVGSHAFIKVNDYEQTIQIAEFLLNDKNNLIQKAVGWMLREIGKRDKKVLCLFLDKFSAKMPSVMLSYSLEHFDKEEKEYYRSIRYKQLAI